MSVVQDHHIKSRERRRALPIVAALLATGLVSVALVVQAPVASTSTTGPTLIPDVAIVPFAGDVFTPGTNGSLIDVDPRTTPASAPLFNLEGSPLTEAGTPLT